MESSSDHFETQERQRGFELLQRVQRRRVFESLPEDEERTMRSASNNLKSTETDMIENRNR